MEAPTLPNRGVTVYGFAFWSFIFNSSTTPTLTFGQGSGHTVCWGVWGLRQDLAHGSGTGFGVGPGTGL